MHVTAEARSRNRAEIAESHKWKLEDIFPDWPAWEAALAVLERRIGEYAALRGTLGKGADNLLAVYKLNDELGQLAYTVYYYPSLKYDEDQRDNRINARRQQVQALMARWSEENVVAESRAARDSDRDRARMDERQYGPGALSVRDRRSVPAAGARARRKRRAAAVASSRLSGCAE
jgi:oligoendopeptidase F